MLAAALKFEAECAVNHLVIARLAMPSPSLLRLDKTKPRRLSRARLGWACSLLALALGGGCASPPQTSTPYVAQTAMVRVENHTDWPWRIAFIRTETTTAPSSPPSYTLNPTRESGPAPAALPWLPLAPREIRRIDLPGGIYRVHRELLRERTDSTDPLTPAETDAGVSLWMVPGRSYTWPLATLFSTEGAAP